MTDTNQRVGPRFVEGVFEVDWGTAIHLNVDTELVDGEGVELRVRIEGELNRLAGTEREIGGLEGKGAAAPPSANSRLIARFVGGAASGSAGSGSGAAAAAPLTVMVPTIPRLSWGMQMSV